MTDLVQRLRACGDPDIDVYVFEEAAPSLLREAADALEEHEKVIHLAGRARFEERHRAEQRIKELEAERDALKQNELDNWRVATARGRRIDALEARLAAAEAERDRIALASSDTIGRLEARLAAAERVVEAAREAQPFMAGNCEHAGPFQKHPENIWCAARHRAVIGEALAAYDAQKSAQSGSAGANAQESAHDVDGLNSESPIGFNPGEDTSPKPRRTDLNLAKQREET